MTQLSDLVVSQELAEQLKAAGFPQKHAYCYSLARASDGKHELLADMVPGSFLFYLSRGEDIIARPTSDELLAVLPASLEDTYGLAYVSVGRNGNPFGDRAYEAAYEYVGAPSLVISFNTDKPADALAQLYLWCVEEGHIKSDGGKS